MKLTQQVHEVRDVAWGGDTRLEAGTLSVDRALLIHELLKDDRLASVDLELVHPGESCRMLPVFDVVEPRAKLDPEGADFPGALSPAQPVGFGVTRVLRGVAVTVLDSAGAVQGRTATIDMRSAPVEGHSAAEVSRYAGLHHVVIVPSFAEGVANDERRQALRLASLRAAVHLAKSAATGVPDEEKCFELGPAAETLPRVAYVFQLHSHQIPTVPGEPLLYGDNCRYLLPTILHPNEILDGAVVRSYYYLAMETYGIQNHALLLDLYRRHGRELNFVGVVVNVANQLAAERERATLMAGNLVRWTLKADGAVFTKSGGGAPNVDMALMADRCEQLGVKTSLLAWETTASGDPEDSALFNSPALDAIVSLGSNGFNFSLGPVERIICPRLESKESFGAAMTVSALRAVGSIDHLGGGRLTTVRY